MTVALDASGTAHTGSIAATTTWSTTAWTLNSGVGLLVVDISLGQQPTSNVHNKIWTLTWGGTPMTQFGTEVQPGSTSQCLRRYLLANPASGNQTLLLTVDSAFGGVGVGVVVASYRAYTGNSLDMHNVASGTANATSAPDLVVTSATGEIVDACYCHGDTINTNGFSAGGTQRTLDNFSTTTAGSCMASGTYAGAGSVTVDNASGVSDHWTGIAGSVFESGPPPPTPDIAPTIVQAMPTYTVASY